MHLRVIAVVEALPVTLLFRPVVVLSSAARSSVVAKPELLVAALRSPTLSELSWFQRK